MTTESKIELGGNIPILRVQDAAASIDYYINKLGFFVNFQWPDSERPFFASIKRGRCEIFLCEGDQGHVGSWVWIDGVDVELLHNEFRAAGAKIRNPPTNYEWALEMQVEDPDGNVLRFGSEPKKDEPIGPWLDMNGNRWIRTPAGKHRKM